jgi:hypothetical protein
MSRPHHSADVYTHQGGLTVVNDEPFFGVNDAAYW